MKKYELIHLHSLVSMVAEEVIGESDFEEIFPVYDRIDVSPVDWSQSNKDDQKQALKTLTSGLTDFVTESGGETWLEDLPERVDLDDEMLVELVGEVYRDNGFSRQESAELIADETDFTYRTVYDKFSDFNINFTFHGDEKRLEALRILEEYADEGFRKKEALEDVSEEMDIPSGTLKNWLTEEGLTFTETVSALVDESSQRELVETAEHYFDFSNPEGVEAMEQALDRNRDTIRQYKKGGIETMPVEFLENLESLFESEPVYRMDNPQRYVVEETPKTVQVEDEFQNYLFSHLDGDEFREMTGKSSTSFNRYRNNKSDRIDKEAYRKVFQTVSYMYSNSPEPEINGFVDRNSYATSSGDKEHSRLEPEEVLDDISLEMKKTA